MEKTINAQETISPSHLPAVTNSIDPSTVSPWLLFGGVFIVASLGGLAALLRSGQELTPRQIFSALLNSGMVGVIIATMLWSRYGAGDPFLLFSVSILAGFGGATTIDLLFQYTRKKLGIIPPKTDENDV
jgi:hypothetical protein